MNHSDDPGTVTPQQIAMCNGGKGIVSRRVWR